MKWIEWNSDTNTRTRNDYRLKYINLFFLLVIVSCFCVIKKTVLYWTSNKREKIRNAAKNRITKFILNKKQSIRFNWNEENVTNKREQQICRSVRISTEHHRYTATLFHCFKAVFMYLLEINFVFFSNFDVFSVLEDFVCRWSNCD